MQKALDYLKIITNGMSFCWDMTNDFDSDNDSLLKTSAICELLNVILHI